MAKKKTDTRGGPRPGAGRPKSNEPHRRHTTVSFNEEERAELSELMKHTGMQTLGQVIRYACRQAANQMRREKAMLR